MSDAETTRGAAVLLDEDERLDLPQFAQACGTTIAYVEEMILEGMLVPGGERPGIVFGAAEITRVRRALRLQRDFDASLPSVAVMLDLLDEIERLRMQLWRAGAETG
ncbi:MAG TPA: chaperone modulator CbpM [Burkholderiaceae bacterium]|nr:chaperone modulator CbpM [Burkholderiaceae bacterium]